MGVSVASVRLVSWRRSGESDVVGVAAVELVEVALVLEQVTIVRRDGRLRVVLPRGAPARDGDAPRLVVRWGSAEIARRFAGAVVAAAAARHPRDFATALAPVPVRPARIA
jgi:hypothetical protein